MKIDIETLKKTKGIGNKTLERIIEQHNSEVDQSLDLPAAPKSMQLNENSLLVGEAVEIMRTSIPDKTIDMVLTSPPYDSLRKYNGYEFKHEQMLDEIYRVLKPGGVCVWIVGDAVVDGSETGSSFKQALYAKGIGFNLHDTMIYAKNNPIPLTHDRYEQQFEYMFVFSKKKPKTFNAITKRNKHAGKRKTGTHRKNTDELEQMNKLSTVKESSIENNIWFYSVNKGSTTKDEIAHKHPAIFPEKLAEDHILSWSNEGDVVLDPMCGSGTTCKMAKKNNRKFIGIDISEEYISIAEKRIKGEQ